MTTQPRPLSDARRRVVLVAGWLLVLLVALILAGYLSSGRDRYGGYSLLVTVLAALSLGAGTSTVPPRWRLVRYTALLLCAVSFLRSRWSYGCRWCWPTPGAPRCRSCP